MEGAHGEQFAQQILGAGERREGEKKEDRDSAHFGA
jgi:hypothetical protein